jgi:transcription-repair coupling factor (superfamily II helicase)
MGSPVPYRVDLFDDEIDSIRTFDPDSQRSLYPVPEVRLLPGREFPMDDAARARFRSRWRELLEGDPTRSRIYKDMGNGVATAGIEYYLPLFFEDTATCLTTWAPAATVVLHGDLEAAFAHFWQDTATATAWCKATRSARCCHPSACFECRAVLRPGQPACPTGAATRAASMSSRQAYLNFTLPDLTVVRGAEDPLGRLKPTPQHPAPGAGAGRERWPPRQPAGLFALQRV